MNRWSSSFLLLAFFLTFSMCLELGSASESPQPVRNRTEQWFNFATAAKWTVEDTIVWLEEELGSNAYSEAFREEEIDGELLMELEDDVLKEVFRIDKAYQRKKIMRSIERMKLLATPSHAFNDFFLYRDLNFRKANVFYICLIQIPRLTLFYQYWNHPEDFEAYFGSPEPGWLFWLGWIFAPGLLCSYYALPFWHNNFIITSLFIYGSLYYQLKEIQSLFGDASVKIDSTIMWKRSFLPPLVIVASSFLPWWVMSSFFYFFLGVLVVSLGLHAKRFMKRENCSLTLPREIELGTKNQTRGLDETVFPPPLKIENNEFDTDTVPHHFLCPITRCIMTQPVITDHGNTYELSAIQEWLKKNHKDPLTNKTLNVTELKPNRILQSMIEEWIQQREVKED